MRAEVHVTLKQEVLDPQGEAVARGLASLGFSGVKRVRVGKLVEIDLEGTDATAAERELKAMCEKLLANPVIEDFRVHVKR